MNFTCAHCGKLINCSAILVDNTFLHGTCEEPFKRAKIYAKWEASGLLDGLKGLIKSDITALMCCKASTLIKE
jgi:hypothetical protein